jgi:hypothetical protein
MLRARLCTSSQFEFAGATTKQQQNNIQKYVTIRGLAHVSSQIKRTFVHEEEKWICQKNKKFKTQRQRKLRTEEKQVLNRREKKTYRFPIENKNNAKEKWMRLVYLADSGFVSIVFCDTDTASAPDDAGADDDGGSCVISGGDESRDGGGNDGGRGGRDRDGGGEESDGEESDGPGGGNQCWWWRKRRYWYESGVVAASDKGKGTEDGTRIPMLDTGA